ncbi:MAG: tripartite tricarboxylate transporter TctB family protein [Candidatus Binatia bacterium]
MGSRIHPGVLFTLLILLIFLGGVFTARHWEFQARMFPWVIGIPGSLLCAAQLAMDLFRYRGPGDPADVSGLMDLPVDSSVPVAVVVRRAINIFAWILGLFATIWIIGFIISVPFFVFLYLFAQAREKLSLSLAYSLIMMAFMVGVFHLVLHIPWPPGIISGPEELFIGWIGN